MGVFSVSGYGWIRKGFTFWTGSTIISSMEASIEPTELIELDYLDLDVPREPEPQMDYVDDELFTEEPDDARD
jgi:hypothetical protein